MDVWLHQGFEAWAAHFCFLVADVPLEGFVGGGAAAVGDGPRVREGQGHPEDGVRGRRESGRRAGRDGQTSESGRWVEASPFKSIVQGSNPDFAWIGKASYELSRGDRK